MKLILKKGDSVTSIIIFVFNNSLMLFRKESIKLSSLLKIINAFGKNETAVRMALSRAVKSGLLFNENTEGEIHYTLTPVGKNAVDIWNEGMNQFWKRYSMRNQTWDKTWYLVKAEYPEYSNEEKMRITDRMQQLGFGHLRAGVWLSPYYQDDEVKNLFENSLNRVIRMHGRLLLDDNKDQFIQKVFRLDFPCKPYEEFLSVFIPKYETTKKSYRQNSFTEKGEALPLLHELGWEFFQIASEDAVLPTELFPKWIGDKAAGLMRDYRQILLESANEYLKQLV